MKAAEQKIYLASKSPRRRELLRQVGVDFELLLLRDHTSRGPADVDESALPDEEAGIYVARVTVEKARAAQRAMFLRKLPMRPILAADTTVVMDGDILGKPADAAEAEAMLKRLSGAMHQVMTCVAVIHDDRLYQETQTSLVTFNTLSNAEIAAYCATTEPYDKAGAYGIQGLAALFVREISGSHSGIMGLPLFETAQLLQQAGIRLL